VKRFSLLPFAFCLALAALVLSIAAEAQVPALPNDRLAGLQWTFVRIRYHSWSEEGRGGPRMAYWEDPWAIDGPAAEQNLSRRIKSVTAVEVGDPVVLELEDERLWQYPWIYMVEPSNLQLRDTEVPILREFLMRGGTLTLDDFHGPYEWDLTVRQLRRVFPEREVVELQPPHPIFTCFYRIEKYPQIPGRTNLGEGRVPAAPARHPRRYRAADGADQLEHRHGRRRGVVQRRGISRLRPLDRAGLSNVDQRGRLHVDALTEVRRVRQVRRV